MADDKSFVDSYIKQPFDFVVRAGEDLSGAIQDTFTGESPEQGALKRDAQRNYKYNYIKYPATLGQDTRHPYYVTFYINIQDLSKYTKDKKGRTNFALTDKGQKIHSTVAINDRERPSTARNFKDSNFGFARKTSRTRTGIRLYMPDTLSWNYTNQFNDVSLSGIPLAKTAAIEVGGISASVEISKSGRK